jgi:hypothetical protein
MEVLFPSITCHEVDHGLILWKIRFFFVIPLKNRLQVHFMIQGFENSFGSLPRIA